MAMIKKSITLTDQQDAWLQSQLATGNYASDSEVIREAIRDKQMRNAELDIIRGKLISAENSGFTSLSREEILEDIKAELRADGKL